MVCWYTFRPLSVLLGVTLAVVTAQNIRIMPLGDSITGSPKLQAAGVTNTDFVGTLPAPGCGISYDGENEGHGGFLATNIASNNQLPGWLASTRPDIVMMHLGTNDVWNNKSPTDITGAFTTLVKQMRASNMSIKILVAQIIPMNPSGCGQCSQRVMDLNKAFIPWAEAQNQTNSPITIVDCWTGFSTGSDTIDGVHPNSSGNQKMANSWFGPQVAAIKSK